MQKQGKAEEAIAAYRQVLQLDPKNTRAYSNLGSLIALQGQPSEAIAVYLQAIRLNPKNVSAFYNLGVTLYNQGDIKKASAALKRARNEYRQQGNTEQADKIEQLIQQIAQKSLLQPITSIAEPRSNRLVESHGSLAVCFFNSASSYILFYS